MSEAGDSGDRRRRPLEPQPSPPNQPKKKAKKISPGPIGLRALAVLKSEETSSGEDDDGDAEDCQRREREIISVPRATGGESGRMSEYTPALVGSTTIKMKEAVATVVVGGGQLTDSSTKSLNTIVGDDNDDQAEPSRIPEDAEKKSSNCCEENGGSDYMKNDANAVAVSQNGSPSSTAAAAAENMNACQMKKAKEADVAKVLLPATSENAAENEDIVRPYPPTSDYADILPLPMFLSTPFHKSTMLALYKLKGGIDLNQDKIPGQINNDSFQEWVSTYIDIVPIIPQKKFTQCLKKIQKATKKQRESLQTDVNRKSSAAISAETSFPINSHQQPANAGAPSSLVQGGQNLINYRQWLNSARNTTDQQQQSSFQYPPPVQQNQEQLTRMAQQHPLFQYPPTTNQPVHQVLQLHPTHHLQSNQQQPLIQNPRPTNQPVQQLVNPQLHPNFTPQLQLPNNNGFTQQQNSYNHIPMWNSYNHHQTQSNPLYQNMNGWQHWQNFAAPPAQANFPHAGIQNVYNATVQAQARVMHLHTSAQTTISLMKNITAMSQQQNTNPSQLNHNAQASWNSSFPSTTAQGVHQSQPQSHIATSRNAGVRANVNAPKFPTGTGAPVAKGVNAFASGIHGGHVIHDTSRQFNSTDGVSNRRAQAVVVHQAKPCKPQAAPKVAVASEKMAIVLAAHQAKTSKPQTAPKVAVASEIIEVSEANGQTLASLPVAFGFYLDDDDSSKEWAKTASQNWIADGQKAIKKDCQTSIHGKSGWLACSFPKAPITRPAPRAPAILLSTKAVTNFPEGWTVKTFQRTSGKTAGHTDRYYYSPKTEVKFRAMTSCGTFLKILDEPGVDGDEVTALKMYKERGHKF